VIICAGEALVDVIPSTDGEPRSVPGGGPMNAAIAAARLGVPTAFVGRVSTDANGDLIWAHLERSGVDLRAAQRGPEPTARAVVTVEPVQSFRFEGDNTADASMTEVDLGPLGPGPHILHTGTLGIFRGDTAETLAGLLAGSDGTGFEGTGFEGIVSFDPNIRPQVFPGRAEWLAVADRWLDRADLVKVSDEDLDWMGMTPADLLDRGATVVLRTAGADGVDVFLAGQEPFTVAAKSVDAVDAVGAGDSFCGAVMAHLHRAGVLTRAGLAELDAATWRDIVGYGVTAAAITVGRLGADPPWTEELAAALASG
jgi:fructokinase